MRGPTLRPIAWICFAALSAPAFTASVPLEAYSRLPALEDIDLSPDGSRMVLVRTAQNTRSIEIVSLADHKSLGSLRVGEQKLRRVIWADDSHLLIETSVTDLPRGLIGKEQEWLLMQVYDVDKHRSTPVPDPTRLHDSSQFMNVIWGRVMVRRINGHTVLFVPGIYVEGRTLPALFVADLETGSERVIGRGSPATRQWLVDAGGEVVAEQEYDEQRRHWAVKIRRDGLLQEAASGQEAIDFPGVLGFGPNADTLLMQTVEGEDAVWRLLSLHDGTLSAPMAERKDLSIPIEDHFTGRMIGGMHATDDVHYVFFDPGMQQRWDSVARAFTGERVRLVSWSDDFQKFVVLVDSAKHGLVYELADLKAHTADLIGEVYAQSMPVFEARSITYTAADGLSIPAYLTLPSVRAAQNLPLIVMVHGGPTSHEAGRFYWWAQALVDQGYAVLQPNYRGSDLSRGFITAGFGQWGRKMQTDLSDGVRYLVKEGIADPARVCIVGAGYGGYAALAGVTLDQGVYRCAVSVGGYTDLKRMLNWINDKHIERNGREQRYWDRLMGASGPDDPLLDTISPIKHIDSLNVPVLLIHGRDDTVVPFEQSSVMADAMRRAKKDVEFVTLQHEDHWLSRSETRLQMLQASVAFLKAHNPPD